MDSISSEEARRIALGAQGFGRGRRLRNTREDLKEVVRRLGLIQIDSVNVVVRAHYMPFFSRLGPYRRELLDDLAYREQFLFEQWGHEASYIPMEHLPLFAHRMARGHRWFSRDLSPERRAYFEAVLEAVRDRGPVTVGDLDSDGRRAGWWGWSHAKQALEWHLAHGNLAVRERRNFTRVYDLPERVFDGALDVGALPEQDAHREMLRNSLRALGIATARDLADYYRLKMGEARPRIAELVDGGAAIPVRVEGWKDPAYLDRNAETGGGLRASALLSPFDSLVWFRERTERLFGFRYRIEIYTPAPQRVYGYYVLPFLYDNRLAARVDLKANRQAGVLEVKAAHLEAGATPARTAAALARELRLMARWLDLAEIAVERRGSLAAPLGRALGAEA